MTTFIDVSSVLMGCGPYTNLVTRPTGAAVRSRIEAEIASAGTALTIIDFSQVELLDFSCADEVVAKLLLADRGSDAHFLFRGLTEAHLDAIDAVLERHRLALVVQLADGAWQLHGTVSAVERLVWDVLAQLARACLAEEISPRVGLEPDDSRSALDQLCRKRVALRRTDGRYAVVGCAG